MANKIIDHRFVSRKKRFVEFVRDSLLILYRKKLKNYFQPTLSKVITADLLSSPNFSKGNLSSLKSPHESNKSETFAS